MRKVALVTGGSSGIGLAVARRLSADHDVTIVDLRSAPEFSFQSADVRDRARAMEIAASMARIDALVTCAGISKDGPLEATDLWDEVLAIDLTGTYNYIAAAAPVFKRQKSGKIVTIASTTAIRARRHLANYVAAKAGVVGLTHAAARDLGKYNVNVNAVAPGLVETALADQIPSEIKERLREETALGRFARPEDVAAVVAFLCSEDARHITGEVIRVDGGQLA